MAKSSNVPLKVRKPKIIAKRRKKATILPREQWGAEKPRSRVPFQLPAYHVMIKYYSDCPPCTNREECIEAMQEMQAQYFQMGLPDLPHNFYIGGDEQIYEGRGWFTKSDKVYDEMPKWDGLSLDIAYIGQREPGREMTMACNDLLDMGVDKRCIVGMFNFEVLTGIDTPPRIPINEIDNLYDSINVNFDMAN